MKVTIENIPILKRPNTGQMTTTSILPCWVVIGRLFFEADRQVGGPAPPTGVECASQFPYWLNKKQVSH